MIDNNLIPLIVERIDCILKEKNISRRKIALKAGVPPSSFQSAMERKSLSLEMLVKIANALNISLNELLGLQPIPGPYSEIFKDKPQILRADTKIREEIAVNIFLKNIGYERYQDSSRLRGKKDGVSIIEDKREGEFFLTTDSDVYRLETSILNYTKYQMYCFLQDLKKIDADEVDRYLDGNEQEPQETVETDESSEDNPKEDSPKDK